MKIQLILDLIKDGVFKGDPEKSVIKFSFGRILQRRMRRRCMWRLHPARSR